MAAVAFGLALAAAVTHAIWNLLLSDAADSEAATAVALLVGALLFAPVALSSGSIHSGALPYLLVSNIMELGYFGLLARAYDRGQVGTIYPVARGSAPVLVLIGSLAAGGRLTIVEGVGVALVGVGVFALRAQRGPASEGMPLALATGVCIAAYTLVDKAGLRYADPLPYLSAAMSGPAVAYFLAVALRKRWTVVRGYVRPSTVVAGAGVFGAYGLTLAALAQGPAAPVAAVRESSIVILTLLAAVVLKRPITVRQWCGAVVVTTGVVALALAATA